jgi:DNA-binding SARP family transcriptional activator
MPIHSPPGHVSVDNGPRHPFVDRGSSRFQLRLLDGFQLEQDGKALWMPHSARRLVAFLGIRGRSSRADVAGTLWPHVPEPRAYASLRTVLWRLNQLIADPVVTGRESLALATTVDADVQTFVGTQQRTAHEDDDASVRTCTHVFPVLGQLLPGWYEDWVLFERERMRQLQIHALEAIAERLTAAERYAEAIDAALAAVQLEPLRESATRALIVAHLAEKNVVEAVRCYESFRDNLITELGVRPTPELERLVQSCVNGQV